MRREDDSVYPYGAIGFMLGCYNLYANNAFKEQGYNWLARGFILCLPAFVLARVLKPTPTQQHGMMTGLMCGIFFSTILFVEFEQANPNQRANNIPNAI